MGELPPGIGVIRTRDHGGAGISVTLSANVAAFNRAMRRTAKLLEDFGRAFWTAEQRHRARHHRVEDPTISAMHRAYNQRRKARRRRGRR